ncbi:hypothetical protein OF83DRAFT_1177745 [Amylostereum chailletii]|nr:hypothetical protein OF83DRAFT_1177745 [Amylostereum chailletii]
MHADIVCRQASSLFPSSASRNSMSSTRSGRIFSPYHGDMEVVHTDVNVGELVGEALAREPILTQAVDPPCPRRRHPAKRTLLPKAASSQTAARGFPSGPPCSHIPPSHAPPSFPDPQTAKNARRQKKKERSKAYRQEQRAEQKQREWASQAVYAYKARENTMRRRTQGLTAVKAKEGHANLPRAAPAFTGHPGEPLPEGVARERVHTLEELRERRYDFEAFDHRPTTCRRFIGPPKEEPQRTQYLEMCKGCRDALEETGKGVDWKEKEVEHRRGKYPTARAGFTMSMGGTGEPPGVHPETLRKRTHPERRQYGKR